MTTKFFFISAIISQLVLSVLARKCYQCNSATSPECEDLSLFKPHLTAGFFKECTDYDDYNGTTPFCRKTVLSIKFPDNVKRTIRSCGWLKSHLSCYRADNDDHSEFQCQCFEDGCNGASRIKIFSILIFIISYFLFFH